MDVPDRGLVALEAEFNAIYGSELTHVWHSLRRHGVPPALLEDAAHEVFVVLYRRLGQLDRSRSLRPYLSAIAMRVASDLRQRAFLKRESPEAEVDTASMAPTPEEAVLDLERRALVQQALAALSDPQRSVFVMHDLDELPMPDVAAALEIKLNTAYSRLRLAREAFTQAIRRLQREVHQ